jgi:ABC-type branched-subunit amino acid transport system ATPase component
MLLRNNCRNSCLEHDFSSREKQFLLVGGRRNRQFLVAKLFHSLSIIHCVDRARARASEQTRVELAERMVELAMEWTEWVELAERMVELAMQWTEWVELAERMVELALEWTEWVEQAEIRLEFGF